MIVEFVPEARIELLDAYDYYEGESPGLGAHFRSEVRAYIEWITGHPTIPRMREGGYRRVNLKVFPYYIPYMIRNETIWILAIAHGYRRPDYFVARSFSVHEP